MTTEESNNLSYNKSKNIYTLPTAQHSYKTDRQTDKPTDRPTDITTYRSAIGATLPLNKDASEKKLSNKSDNCLLHQLPQLTRICDLRNIIASTFVTLNFVLRDHFFLHLKACFQLDSCWVIQVSNVVKIEKENIKRENLKITVNTHNLTFQMQILMLQNQRNENKKIDHLSPAKAEIWGGVWQNQ